MHQNFTKLNPSFFRSGLVLMFALLFAFSNTMGQTYTNGNLSTGDTAANGTVAPTGYSFSQMQPGAGSFGFSASIANGFSLADDFIIPAGQAWTISNMVFYAYSTGYTGATSPFNKVRVRIFNTNPKAGNVTPIYGDTATNRFASSADAKVYRISTTPDLTRKIWSVTATTPVQLGPGHYWVEFQIGTTSPTIASNFTPPSVIRGALTAPGYNALSHSPITDNSAAAWGDLLDGTANMDIPFKINYTSCSAPTVTIASTGGCIPATLTASGATTYTWSPAAGLNTTTGATVTANPVGTTTYTVTGTTAGCVGTASIQLTNPFTSATLTGVTPSQVLIDESFNDSLPTGWLSINNSDVPGPVTAWGPGVAAIFPSHSGAPGAYILGNYQLTAGDVISTWMLTKEVPIKNGDKISFWTRTTTGDYPDRLELRMSTAGAGSDVGSTPTSVGTFTNLLLTINPDLQTGDAYPSVWTKYEATISGVTGTSVTGRFGFRYFVTNAGPDGDNSDNVGVDDVLFTSPQSCTPSGSTQNISVNITGGAGPYTVVYSNGSGNITVPNYTSGASIPVVPNGTTTYSLVSVTSGGGCTGQNVSGSFTFSGGTTITTQPDSLTTVCGSGPATIRVVVAGTGNTYQWQVSTDGGTTFTNVTDGANYSGATTSTLTLSNLTSAMTGYIYHVNITGTTCPGVTTSRNSKLSVAATTVITSQPENNYTCIGETAPFSVVSNGVTFQWQVSTDGGATFSDIPQANSATLLVPSTSAVNNNQYRVIVGNGCGINVTSTAATLTVSSLPTITTQPAATTAVCGTSTATISVAATGTGNSYQWQISTDGGATFTQVANGASYSGATSATLSILNPSAAMTGNVYYVIISSGCGSVSSNNSTLSVATQTTITTQPTNVTTCAGQTVTFNVVSNGVTFQWQQSADGGATFTDIPQENSSTITVVAINNSQLRVIIGNGCGVNTTSNAATLTVSAASTITTQPSATTAVCGSATGVISVTATGTENTYQWQVSTDGGTTFTNIADGANYSGTTSATLSVLNPTQSMSGYIYHVNITSGCGVLTSTNSTLSVAAQTTITGQPTNKAACQNSTATFTVVSNGTTFQWQVSTDGTTFTDIPGATSATYVTAPATQAMNGYLYHVVVGGCSSSVTSSNATLSIAGPATISTQPASVTACEGQNTSFSVVAAADSLNYQWQVSTDGGATFTNIPQANASTLNVNATTANNNNQYKVIVGNGCGNTVNSTAATLTVTAATVITAQPQAVTICAGSDATFTVTATGNNLSYQWVSVSGSDTTNITGATSASYTATAATAAMNGTSYYAIVTSSCGNLNSSAAALTVNSTSAITTEDQTGCEGSNVTFTANGAGAGTTFQWQVSTDGGATFTNIAGETSATLVLTSLTSQQGGNKYQVVGTGSCGSATSNAATLSVSPNPTVGVDGPADAVCSGSSVTLTGTGATTYTFDNNVTSGVPFTIGTANTTYTVTGTTSGCTGTATFTVTVNPSPVVTLTSTATALNEGETATITAASTPAVTAYVWYKDGVEIAGSTGSSITVTYANPGVYTASVEAGGCSATSNAITITAIPVNQFFSFITPNPNNGKFTVNYRNDGSIGATRVISIFDSKGSLIYLKSFPITPATAIEKMEVDITNLSSGTYHLLLSDGSAKRLKTASFIKQ